MIPTFFKAPVCPCITFPIKLPILTILSADTFTPFCCTARLFMAGIRVFKALSLSRKVASCCAPLSCSSSPTTPSFCCSLARSFTDWILLSEAFILCFMTVSNFNSAASCTLYASIHDCPKSFIALTERYAPTAVATFLKVLTILVPELCAC